MKKDLCKCKICSKQFEYGDHNSPMLKEEIWEHVVNFFGLKEFEIQATKKCNYRTRLDNENAHLWICSDCMEKALGRKLRKEDLNGYPFNVPFIEYYFK